MNKSTLAVILAILMAPSLVSHADDQTPPGYDPSDPILVDEQKTVVTTVTEYITERRCVAERYGFRGRLTRYVWRDFKVPVQKQYASVTAALVAYPSLITKFGEDKLGKAFLNVPLTQAPQSTQVAGELVAKSIRRKFSLSDYQLKTGTPGDDGFPVRFISVGPHKTIGIWYQMEVRKIGPREIDIKVFAYSPSNPTEQGSKSFATTAAGAIEMALTTP